MGGDGYRYHLTVVLAIVVLLFALEYRKRAFLLVLLGVDSHSDHDLCECYRLLGMRIRIWCKCSSSNFPSGYCIRPRGGVQPWWRR